ncbi:MAG: DegT/DnrJ/EryC1/StrS family aminotransferase [Candidatus Aenigmarchaeota archaeon]|nr:DegT/DnrJ/EryC1/StrS family aminotransferase [Candidatus Aenigmarchaeota archaeon]
MPGFELIGDEERKEINSIFDNKGILYRYGFDKLRGNSWKVKEFETNFSNKLSVKYSHAVTSGTAALHTALMAMGIKPGDEVITSSYTFVATAEAIIACGAKPVFTDIDFSINMDPNDIENRITKKTKIIVPVHMHGSAADMKKITEIAKKHSILVLEDSCQALGAKYRGKMLGTIADMGVFSFDYGKVLTTGEGGMVVSDKKEFADKADWFADHGHEHNTKFSRADDTRSIAGFNYRMCELQGAIGVAQLKKLDVIVNKQRENKKRLKKELDKISGIEYRKHNDTEEAGDSLIFFVKDSKIAKDVVKELLKVGIETKNLPSAFKWHFAGTWDHMLPKISEDYKNPEKLWTRSQEILNRALAIGISLNMTDEHINKISNAISTGLKE